MRVEAIARPSSSVRVAFASLVGTSIEWYDFLIYGLSAALVFPELFFPKYNAFAGLLASYAIFWTGFLARPLGGAIFGHFGDRIGRKAMLVTTLAIMGTATFAIGLLPTYREIGLWGAVLLVMLRMLQGIAVGGEWGGAVLMATEHAPSNMKGFFGSWPQMGVPIGLILANVVFRNVSELSWRIPFLLSIFLVAIGLIIRLSVDETPAFDRLKARGALVKVPIVTLLRNNWKTVLLAAGAFFVVNGGFYLRVTQIVSYGAGPHSALKLDPTIFFNAMIAASSLSLLTVPLAGALSDRFGRRPIYIAGATATLVLAFPFYALIDTKNAVLITLALVLWELCSALMYAPLAALFCELFACNVRYSGASIGYQLVTIFAGGMAPFIATSLLQFSGGASWVLSLYLTVMAAITLVSILLIPETKDMELAS
jgi:MFS transporter, MHS family, shikimate and dehydroshikimate transport protein